MLKGCVIGCKKRCITLRKSLMSHSRRIHLEVRFVIAFVFFCRVFFSIKGIVKTPGKTSSFCSAFTT